MLPALCVVHVVRVYRFRTGPGVVPAVCAVCGPCGACLRVSHQAGRGACCLHCVWSMRCVSTGFAPGQAWCLLSALCVVHAVRVYRFRTRPGMVPAVCAVCGPCGACLQVSYRAGHGACCLRCVWSMRCVSTGFAPGRAWCLLSALCVIHAVRVYRFRTGPGVVPAVCAVCGPCGACLQVSHWAGRGACCLRCVWSMRCVSTGFAPGRAWCLLSALCVVHVVRVYRFRTGPGVVPAVWAVCGPCSACLQVLHRAGRGACCLGCVWSMQCVSTGFAPGRAWCLLSALCVVHAVRVYRFRTGPGVVPAVCAVCGPCGACLQVSHRAGRGAAKGASGSLAPRPRPKRSHVAEGRFRKVVARPAAAVQAAAARRARVARQREVREPMADAVPQRTRRLRRRRLRRLRQHGGRRRHLLPVASRCRHVCCMLISISAPQNVAHSNVYKILELAI